MKKWFIIASLSCITGIVACHTGSGSHSGKDTVGNRYGSANDTNGSAKSTIDTSKASSADYSASGGTKTDTDSLVKKGQVKK